jgi:hypothetical protein
MKFSPLLSVCKKYLVGLVAIFVVSFAWSFSYAADTSFNSEGSLYDQQEVDSQDSFASEELITVGDADTAICKDRTFCPFRSVTDLDLLITEYQSPKRDILIDGFAWNPVAKYKFESTNDEIFEIHRLTIVNDMEGVFGTPVNSKVIKSIWIVYPDTKGTLVAQEHFLENGSYTFELSNTFRVQGSVKEPNFIIFATLNKSDLNFSGKQWPIYSGKQLRLGIKDIGNNSATFFAKNLTQKTAITYPVIMGSENINAFEVRAAKPKMSILGYQFAPPPPQGDAILKLLEFRVRPDREEHVFWLKQFTFFVDVHFSELTDALQNFSLWSVEEDSAKYTEFSSAEIDIATLGIDLHKTENDLLNADGKKDGNYKGPVVITFKDPIAISSANTFVLKATAKNGYVMSDYMTIFLMGDNEPLADNMEVVLEKNPHLIWSDLHSHYHDLIEKEWTNGFFIPELPTKTSVVN